MNKVPLSNEEIDLIVRALNYVHDKKLDILQQNGAVLSEQEGRQIQDSAFEYWGVANKLKNFEKQGV